MTKTRAEEAVAQAARVKKKAKGSANMLRINRHIPNRAKWLWEHVRFIGSETLDFGRKGTGKSTRADDFAARVSTGRAHPGEAGFEEGLVTRQPHSVIIMTTEDDPDIIKFRLIAMGANLTNIHILTSKRIGDEEHGFDLGADFPILEDEVIRLKAQAASAETDYDPLGLIMISPISAYTGIRDSNDVGQIRSLLSPIARLIKKHRIAAWYTSHPRKGEEGNALDQHLGTSGVVNAVRIAYISMFDPEDTSDDGAPKRRLWMRAASNLEQDDTPYGFAYKIVGTKIVTAVREPDGDITPDAEVSVQKIEWLGRDDRRPDDVLAQWRDLARPAKEDKKADAMVLIMAELVGGPKSGAHMNRVKADANAGDVTWRNARKQLQEANVIVMDGAGRDVTWRLGDGVPWDENQLPNQPPAAAAGDRRPEPPPLEEVPDAPGSGGG